jgi:hypothetical protein
MILPKTKKTVHPNVSHDAAPVAQDNPIPSASEPSGSAESGNGECPQASSRSLCGEVRAPHARPSSPTLLEGLSSSTASKATGAERWAEIKQRQKAPLGRTALMTRRTSSIRNTIKRTSLAARNAMKRTSSLVRNTGQIAALGRDGEVDVGMKWGGCLRWDILWAKDTALQRRIGLIHHQSKFARLWPRVVNTTVLLTALFLPPVVSWGQGEWGGFLFQFFMGGVLIANTIVRQLTTVSTSREPLQTHTEIRRWYVRNELFLDLVSTVPYGVMAMPGVISPTPRGSLELFRLLQWPCLMRIFRDDSLDQLALILLEMPSFYKWLGTLKLVCFWFLHLHLCASLLHFGATRYDTGAESLPGWLELDAPAEHYVFEPPRRKWVSSSFPPLLFPLAVPWPDPRVE